jgi:hypothetical protein
MKFVPSLVEGRQLYQYTAIDCCTRLRLVQFSEELTVTASKTFVQVRALDLPVPGPVRPDG